MGDRRAFASLVAVLVLALPAAEGVARAQAGPRTDACLTTPVDGQKQRRADKLLEARESFSACARRTCPAKIVQQCTRWLHEVEELLPSVVLVARDAAGNDVLDAQVAIDDQPPTEVGTRAIPLNPGPHKFTFHEQGVPDVQEDVLLREGERARTIVAILRPPAPPTPAAPPPPAPMVTTRPVPLVVWILGGVAVVGAAGFATFGTLGVVERGSDCGVAGCTQAQKDSIETKFRIGDVSLAVGVASVIAGGILFFTRPRVERPAEKSAEKPGPAAWLDMQPTVGGASLVVAGHF